MSSKHPNLFFILFLGAAGLSALILCWQWFDSVLEIETAYAMTAADESTSLVKNSKYKREKTNRVVVKGLYLTAYSVGNSARVDSIIELINKTELNAVVIDIKDYSGKVLYDSNLEMVNNLGLEDNRIGDVQALVDKFHDSDIYVIARQTVFQDPVLAEVKPEWAIKNKGGGLWRDNLGLAWVDPTQKSVWNYNIAVAREAVRMGFDEVNFDYVRFPSDGNMSNVVYTNGNKERYEVMHDFFSFLSEKLSKEPVWISIDMFGFVMEKTGTDDMNIGQRLVDAVDEIDYICPMMYPSHYPSGHLGLDNPADYPGLVITNGMKKGAPMFEDKRAQVRPWIQAFHIGAYYDATKIRAQIDSIEEYPNAGWLLWNAANKYTDAGLLVAEDAVE